MILNPAPIVVLRGVPAGDAYNPTSGSIDWSSPTRRVDVAAVQPISGQGTEVVFEGDRVITLFRLYHDDRAGPMDLTAADRVEYPVGGDVYEVTGDLERWSGRLATTVAVLRKVAG